MKRSSQRSLKDTFIDLLLEERYSVKTTDAAPAEEINAAIDPGPRRRRAVLTAVGCIALGVTVVVATGVNSWFSEPEADNEAQDRTRASSYFPLRLGNVWRYRDAQGDETRAVTVRATAAGDVDGVRVAQLTEVGGDRPVFTFWSSDKAGVYRHSGTTPDYDPCLARKSRRSKFLSSPTKVGTEWAFTLVHGGSEMMQGAGTGAGGGGAFVPDRTARKREFVARLMARDKKVEVGERTFDCLHLRLEEKGAGYSEDVYLARRVGLVKRRVRKAGVPDVVRTLVGFEHENPAPDRQQLLAMTTSADLASKAFWLDTSSKIDAQWTLRSEFAAVPTNAGTKIYRVFGDRAVEFEPANLASYQLLAEDERFAERVGGLCTQRMVTALVWLRWQLHQLATGERFEVSRSSFSMGDDHSHGEVDGRLVTASGERAVHVEVIFADGAPESVDMR